MKTKEFGLLLDHYRNIFDMFDDIHFNSSVSERVYHQHLDVRRSAIIPITHSQIEDHRVLRNFEQRVLKLIFVGNVTAYKGFPLLSNVLQELNSEGYREWVLDVWGASGFSECESINFRGSFLSHDLPKLFCEDALLVVPSVWSETFSLVTLEAISYGIPALVSSSVGAKDVVAQYDSWFVFANREELKNKLLAVMQSRKRLQRFNSSIVHSDWHHSIESHAKDIERLYSRQG